MGEHPDVVVGSTTAEHGAEIQVIVTGVDVRLDIRQRDAEDAVVWLGPDEASNLIALLERALET